MYIEKKKKETNEKKKEMTQKTREREREKKKKVAVASSSNTRRDLKCHNKFNMLMHELIAQTIGRKKRNERKKNV